MTAYVDTGGWVALLVREDRWHGAARQAFADPQTRWTTSAAVLGETFTWLRYHATDPALATRFMQGALANEQHGRLQVVREDRDLERDALGLAGVHADVSLSWPDLVGLAICGRGHVPWILGVDAHLCLSGASLLLAP